MKFGTTILIALLVFAGITSGAASKDPEAIIRPAAKAMRAAQPPSIDGKLDEAMWQTAFKITDLKQREPVEGAKPTESTEVHILYDDEALYIGARMYDSHPDSITARLGRRDDQVSADMFYFYIDPYLDHRTGYYFALNAAGAFFDGVLYNDDWNDNSWDGVWQGKVNIDSQGWTAEMKIPYSQLRFHKADSYTWGINFQRIIERKNELDYLVYKPRNGAGFVSRFAELHGIENIAPPSRIEVLPYAIGRAEYLNHDANDPFKKNSNYVPGFGLDFKVGFGSNLTLNATINPDFGQVEVDPAVVNLSDQETFFQEKRPFFIEGSSIFNFGVGGANNYWGFNWAGSDLFYSRRIGRSPQGSLPDNDYSDVPTGTHILSAAKLSGKIENWNIGTINAVTRREYADLQFNGAKSSYEVEPLTYYGVYRAQRDFNDGKQGLGFMSTYTDRFFSNEALRNDINKNAFAFGLDGWSFLDDNKEWVFTGWLAGTHVTGSKERITDLQRNPLHYFQRPDLKYLSVDSNATSLSGYSGRFYINKQKGNFFFNSAFGIVSPGYDVNDAGYMWRTDVINMHVGGGYNWSTPGKVFRSAELGGAVFSSFDFGGYATNHGVFHFGYVEFLNYYSINWNLGYYLEAVNDRRTRGGPMTINAPGVDGNISISSDNRKNWVFNLGYYGDRSENKSYDQSVDLGIEWRPAPNVSVSISPGLGKTVNMLQWVDVFDDPNAKETFGHRYVFAKLNQTTLSAGIRLNWTFTPALSLQLYMQPLISSGSYTEFKELSRPQSNDYRIYGQDNSTITLNDGEYTVNPDVKRNDQRLVFSNPDFNFKSLRGNIVLRWEYHPGSTLYFVWTQSRSQSEDNGEFSFSRSFNKLFDTKADNIFMMKFTYWFTM